MRPCKICGLDLDLVGRSHRCVPRVANSALPMANIVDDVANTPPPAVDVANSTSTYRYRDAERRRAYMRELMRKKRAGSRPLTTTH
jgi:hypothetical protein